MPIEGNNKGGIAGIKGCTVPDAIGGDRAISCTHRTGSGAKKFRLTSLLITYVGCRRWMVCSSRGHHGRIVASTLQYRKRKKQTGKYIFAIKDT